MSFEDNIPSTKKTFPGEVRQVLNFIEARRRTKQTEYEPATVQTAILYGLSTIVPEELENSGILSSKIRMKVVDSFLNYQMRLNDRLDFDHSGRGDLADAKLEVRKKESEAEERLNADLLELDSPQIEMLIHNAKTEVEHVERYISLRKYDLTFDEIEKYRNLINAISNCAVTAIILGTEDLINKLKTIAVSDMNFQAIYDKYRWVFGSDYRSAAERAVMIMHNMAMAAQVDDDWHGRRIDELLKLPSFASGAIKEKDGDQEQAQKFLGEIKKTYLDKAGSLGLGIVPKKGINGIQSRMQKTMGRFTRTARYNRSPRLRRFAQRVVDRMGIREQLYGAGKL